jgi:hypothetical protein
MQSEKPARLVHWFAEECNNIIARQMKLFPNTFLGVCALPQAAGEPMQNVLPELERCVKLGFVGCLLNPDPYENGGQEAPSLGDRYWYPLYEKLCELDVPAHIHGTGSRSERSPYSVHFINEETMLCSVWSTRQCFRFSPTENHRSHGGALFRTSSAARGAVIAPRTGAPFPTPAQAILRHRALHRGRFAAVDQNRRRGPLPAH